MRTLSLKTEFSQKPDLLNYPGSESVILALFVSGDVMVRISPVPSELIFLVGWHVDVLEVAVGLLAVASISGFGGLLRVRVCGGQADGDCQDELKLYILFTILRKKGKN